jgi:hypothetical protein
VEQKPRGVVHGSIRNDRKDFPIAQTFLVPIAQKARAAVSQEVLASAGCLVSAGRFGHEAPSGRLDCF